MLIKLNISRLKQRLSSWNQVLDRLSPQNRRLARLAGAGVILVLLYLVVVSPLIGLQDSWTQELDNRQRLLVKYQALLATKDKVFQAHKTTKTALDRTETQFLSGAGPAVASADLQEILKTLTGEQGVQMVSAKVLPPREAGPYLEVPVQVQLTGSIGQLIGVLYHLEHHKKLLFIPELDVNAPRFVKGAKSEPPLQVNLVVSGVIKKGVPS